jgi:hypothetical protein
MLLAEAASLLGCNSAAATLARIECAGGKATACFSLGRLYAEAEGLRDYPQATALFRKACDGGVTDACVSLGDFYARGEGVTEDRKQALRMYRRACDAKWVATDCDYYPVVDYVLLEPGVDPVRAAAENRKACEGGDAKACFTLGELYQIGKGVALDREQTVLFFQKACDGGVARACFELGRCYEWGTGVVAPDFVQAMSFYRQACDGGAFEGCHEFCCR